MVHKVLSVAEKNDAAKGISAILSSGRSQRVSKLWLCFVAKYVLIKLKVHLCTLSKSKCWSILLISIF